MTVHVAFGAGTYVCQKIDPRHLGRVRYSDSHYARVQWEDSGWISEHHRDELDQVRDIREYR